MNFILGFFFTILFILLSVFNVSFSLLFMVLVLPCLYYFDKKSVMALWVCLFLFSNVFISLLSPLITERLTFDFMRGADFIVLCYMLFLYAIANFKLVFDKKLLFILLICIFIFIYYLKGFASVGFGGSTTYLRYYLYPVIFFFLVFRMRLTDKKTIYYFLLYFILFSIYVFFEYFFTAELYEFINFHSYLELKYKERYIPDLNFFVDGRYITIFKWEDLLFKGFRASGPLLHAISSGYLIVLISVLLYITSNRKVFLVVASVLTIMLLSKGAFLLSIVILVSVYLKSLGLFNARVYYSMYLFYLGFSFLLVFIGLVTNNPHHYSLISSFYGVIDNPIGGGIGVGGTISTGTTYDTEIDTSSGDSALALFNNMFGILGCFFYFYMIFKSFSYNKMEQHKNFNESLFFLIVFVLICNGISQEEAINPSATSMLVLIGYFVFHVKKNCKNNVQ
jgi:hypothetical protein